MYMEEKNMMLRSVVDATGHWNIAKSSKVFEETFKQGNFLRYSIVC